jgi:hypothetical protein
MIKPRLFLLAGWAIFVLFSFCAQYPHITEDPLPIAIAGEDTSYFRGDTVVLNAGGSYDPVDSINSGLTYIWEMPYSLEILGWPKEIVDSSDNHRIAGLPKGTYIFTLKVRARNRESIPRQVTISILGPQWIVSKSDSRFGNIRVVHSIKSALDSAQENDTIFVDKGIYYENIVIAKNGLALISADAVNTIIDGRNRGPTVSFQSVDNSSFSKFTVINGAEIENCAGIKCTLSTNITIDSNYIRKNNTDAIRLFGCLNVVASNNCLDSNKYHAIKAEHSQLQLIRNNITNNGWVLDSFPERNVSVISLAYGEGQTSIGHSRFSRNRCCKIWLSNTNTAFENDTFLSADTVLYCESAQNRSLTFSSNIVDGSKMLAYFKPNSSAKFHLENNIIMGSIEGICADSASDLNMISTKNRFDSLTGYCIHFVSHSNGLLRSSNDTFIAAMTPVWCNDTREMSISNDYFYGNHTGSQKGLDLWHCDSGVINASSINNYEMGIIYHDVSILIKNNQFRQLDSCIVQHDSCCDWIDATPNAICRSNCSKQPVIGPNDTASCMKYLGYMPR